MKSYVQWIGAGALDSGAFSLLLFFDEHRYLFNCSEGTQRAAIIDGVRLSKVDTCLLTSLEWARMGGLVGLFCTMRDQRAVDGSEHSPFTLVGPAHLNRLLESTRPFLHRSSFNLHVKEFGEGHFSYSDGFLQIHGFHINQSRQQHLSKKIKGNGRSDVPFTIGYLVKPPAIPGKFDIEKVKRLGIRPGPDYGRLVRGECVRLGDGALLKPAECVGQPSPHPYILILDLPSLAHFEYLMEAIVPECEDLDKVTDVFIFGQDYGPILPHARHHAAGFNNNLTNFDSLQYHASLNSICNAYRMPKYTLADGRSPKPFEKIHMHPEYRVDGRYIYDKLNGIAYAHDELDSARGTRISFLGTAAAIPGKYRNVSGILVSTCDGHVMFDCGEATWGQLHRLMGADAQSTVDNLLALCLTHLHADHHLGALSIILNRQGPPLKVFAPIAFRQWFDEYAQSVNIPLNMEFISCSGQQDMQLYGHEVTNENQLVLKSFPVDHCPDACGFLLQTCKGNIVYSGDTRPSDRLIEMAENALLLIHEATMPDDLQDEAVSRKHCTVSEAVRVHQQAHCQHCILTHFSQRFSKSFPKVDSVGLAADLLSVDLHDLHALPSINSKLYQKECE